MEKSFVAAMAGMEPPEGGRVGCQHGSLSPTVGHVERYPEKIPQNTDRGPGS
jgi:hypothetical protein